MTRKRTSYTRKSALRFLHYFNELVEQTKRPNPKGMFIPYSTFGETKPVTLINRMTDALLWLRNNRMEGSKFLPEDYEFLFAVMKKKAEPTGIRFTLLSGSPVKDYLRDQQEVETPMDWKDEVVTFIENPKKIVERFSNCVFTPESIEWLVKVTSPLKAQYHIEGDVLTIFKQG